MNDIVFYALLATLGTWLVTALGAATVVLFKSPNPKILNLWLGFAAGVRLRRAFVTFAAGHRARGGGGKHACVFGGDTRVSLRCIVHVGLRIMRDLRAAALALAQGEKNARLNRIILLVLSITLHNIPEGLAVGVAFGALKNGGYTPEALMGAVTVAVGIGLQNFPEGAAVSLPLQP